jgi:hypothetical protein
MNRFLVGFLVGVLTMYVWGGHADWLKLAMVDWFEGAAANYGGGSSSSNDSRNDR